jgi:hypothetical protein
MQILNQQDELTFFKKITLKLADVFESKGPLHKTFLQLK